FNANTGSLLAVQTNVVSSVWIMPYSSDLVSHRLVRGQFPIDESGAIQIASVTGRMQDVAWTNDGRVVYVSQGPDGSNVWISEPGVTPRQLTLDGRNIHGLAVSPDSRYMVLSSDRGGTFNLWRAEIGRGELVRLTSGEGDVFPRFSPDGRWAVYPRGYPVGARIWRVPIDGGESTPLTETRAQTPDVSPDGKLIAYHTLDSEPVSPSWVFGTMSFDGGRLIKRFRFAPTVGKRLVRWVPGGWGLAFL